MFDNLTGNLQEVFKQLSGKGKISENNIKNAMREVRIALLEADVNFKVVKEFVKVVTEKAIGEKVLKSLTPDQQVIKIVHEELKKIVGDADFSLNLSVTPSVILLVGLQGSGKTTTAAKLANYLRKQNHKPLLAACDVYRPAAIDQLKTLGDSINIPVYLNKNEKNVVKIANQARKEAMSQGCNILIVDTAGRLHIDSNMMDEVEALQDSLNPQEILFVADAMTGQDAVTVAKEFNDRLEITGVVLTKLDGDARGGAAISIRQITGRPIKFVGLGEKTTELEPFHPDRMASRILGMGDMLTLVEKAEKAIDEEQAKKLEKRLKKGQFTFDDFLNQLQQIKKMGPLEDLLSMIPGFSQMKEMKHMMPGEKDLKNIECIIQSMTLEERANPKILNGNRRKRIAKGSGTSINDVNKLVKQFEQTQKMIKKFSKGNIFKGGFPGMNLDKMPF